LNTNRRFKLILVALLGLSFSSFSIASKDIKNKDKDPLKQFSLALAEKSSLKADSILSVLKTLKPNKNIIKKMNRPAESLDWHRYRPIWMKKNRIEAGAKFLKKHQATLERAEKVYGVDKMIIVAIIGIETFYGRHKGTHSVLDALYTLAFHYPKRATFFTKELQEYFILAQEQNWDLKKIKGSYAGAMGIGQFISSSYRMYGVDFNGDGKIDLLNDPVDMIGSVAYYFKRHGWKKGKFIAKKIIMTQSQAKALVQKELRLNRTAAELKQLKINVDEVQDQQSKVGVFSFKLKKGEEHWLAANNFYTITRYNHNAMYALAVLQLSVAIKKQLKKKLPTVNP